jgi:hypothetical protein
MIFHLLKYFHLYAHCYIIFSWWCFKTLQQLNISSKSCNQTQILRRHAIISRTSHIHWLEPPNIPVYSPITEGLYYWLKNKISPSQSENSKGDTHLVTNFLINSCNKNLVKEFLFFSSYFYFSFFLASVDDSLQCKVMHLWKLEKYPVLQMLKLVGKIIRIWRRYLVYTHFYLHNCTH